MPTADRTAHDATPPLSTMLAARRALGALIALGLWSASADAASLQVAPVTLDVPAQGAAATISLRNAGVHPMQAQIRVMRWRQVDGVERLEPAADVVASPPAVTLAPNADYAVRVIRLDRTPLEAEASYRLLIDELPNPAAQRNGAIALVLRHSIPVFFNAQNASAPRVSWSISRVGGKIVAIARNDGGRRLRLAALKLRDGAARTVGFGDGLAGYVLAGATMRFVAPSRAPTFGTSGARVTATTDLGPLDAVASAK